MKRFVVLLFLALFVFSFSSCKKAEETVEQSSQSGQSEESAVQEYSGAVYTVRTDYEDGVYALREYRENGTVITEKIYNGKFIQSESYYDINGQIERQTDYKTNGDLLSDTYYTVNGREVVKKFYDNNGNYTGKAVTTFNESDLISRVISYNKDGALGDETYYEYNSLGELVKKETSNYDNDIPSLVIIQNIDPKSGNVLQEEAIQYDSVTGEFLLHEVYEIQGDEIVIIGRYDEQGNSLPIEPFESEEMEP